MKRRRIGLMIMVDALGARLLRECKFLDELPYRASLRPVLGFSCACQPTLLSGKMPVEHGHGAMYTRRGISSVLDAARPFDKLPSFVADNHRVRSRIYGRVASQVGGYFSLYDVPTRLLPRFDLVEQKSIFEPGGLRNARSIFDALVDLELNFRSYDWRTAEIENLANVERDIDSGNIDFVFLYLPHLDGLMHRHGPGGDQVLAHLAWYESRIRVLLEKAHDVADIVEFYLFSDHGMSPVHGGFDLMSPVERAFGRNGDRYLAFYDSTMARFWTEDSGLAGELEQLLNGRGEGRLIPEEERESLGIRFPDRSQGDHLFVADEGLLVMPSYMGRSMLSGMHGYHPDATHAEACLLGLRSPDRGTEHIADLYRLMESAAVRLSEEKD